MTTALGGAAVAFAAAPSATTAWVLLALACGKAVVELPVLLRRRGDDLGRTAALLRGDLARGTAVRFALLAAGGAAAPALLFAGAAARPVAVVGAALVVGGELVERSQFFRAVVAPRMPGQLP
jgi:hypothetical protein